MYKQFKRNWTRCDSTLTTPREVILRIVALHQDRKALEVLAMEIAPVSIISL
jgi:hypothetical protein